MAYEFNHVHLKSPDPEKTANWYVKAFDFKIISDVVRPYGDRFIRCQTSDGVAINISSERTDEQMGGGDATVHWGIEHFGINVDDIDAEIKRLKDLGADLMEGPIDAGGLQIAFIKAPDDVRIEIMQYS
jgi:catechol 2,3-dioxygenase-like lactoylglutathione lyase family enzyme